MLSPCICLVFGTLSSKIETKLNEMVAEYYVIFNYVMKILETINICIILVSWNQTIEGLSKKEINWIYFQEIIDQIAWKQELKSIEKF